MESPTADLVAALEHERRINARYRFLARATDQLFETLDPKASFQRLVDNLIAEYADWAFVLANEMDHLVVSAMACKDGRDGKAFRNVRLFRPAAERAILADIRGRRSRINNAARVRGAIRPYLFAEFRSLRPKAVVTAPIYCGSRPYGALQCSSATRAFDQVDLELLDEIARRVGVALEHAESFARERRLTQTLQQATLPIHLPPVPGVSISSIYCPAALDIQVGGDWYDAFQIDENRTILSIGDVVGHGLQAAVVMGKLRHTINVVSMYERDPARILDAAERIVLNRYPETIATTFVAIYDSNDRSVTFANAGHYRPVVRRWDGSLERLEAEGLPIGTRSMAEPSGSATRSLDDVSAIVFYTDGLVEETHDLNEGEAALHDAVSTEASLYARSPAEFIQDRCLTHAPSDDVAILVLDFARSSRWAFDADNAAAAQSVRADFMSQLRDLSDGGSDFAACEIIFGELVANVARHAPGAVDIALEWRSEQAVLHVIDRGPGFRTALALHADVWAESGRGLWLVRQLSGDLEIEPLPGFGSHVTVALPSARSSGASP